MKELFCNSIDEVRENMEYFSVGHIFNKSTKAIQEWDYNTQKDINILRLESKRKYNFICQECGSTYAKSPQAITAHTKNHGKDAGICNFCYGKETNHTNCLFATHPITKELWSERNTLDPYTIRSTKRVKAWWKCPDCSEEFKSNIGNTVQSLMKGNTGCPYCRGFKTNDKNSVANLFPELEKEWHPTKNKFKLSEVTQFSDKRIHWICKNGHEWNTMIKDRTRERIAKDGSISYTGCPYCANYKVWKGFNDIATLYPELIPNIVNKEDALKWTTGSGNKIEWKCTGCDTYLGFKSVKNVTAHGLFCPICSSNASSPERLMASVLKNLDIKFDHNQGFTWSDNRFYDFYLRDYNLIIELHGEQHFFRSDTSVFNQNRTLEEEQLNDAYKKQMALENGVKHYVEIPCINTEFLSLKETISQHKELQQLLPINQINWSKVLEYYRH